MRISPRRYTAIIVLTFVECPMDIVESHANTADAECIRYLECVETCARPETLPIKFG